MCPQKQCLSGKADGLSGRTNQRLPTGGSSRRSRVRESALQERHCLFQSNAGSFHRYRGPPSSRRKAILLPDSTPKRCNTLYLGGKACEKEYERIVRTPFVVGRGFISRRFIKFMLFVAAAPRHRPTMLSVKSALWKTSLMGLFYFCKFFFSRR